MQIHGYAALSPSKPLELFTYPLSPLNPFEVLIQVSHCGLCYSDIHLVEDNWKKSIYPLIPGHEVIGTVVQKGDQVDAVNTGDRVGVSWIRGSCLNCPQCICGDTNICAHKTATCNGHFGGFADYLVGDSRFVFAIPEEIDSAHAAPLLCAGATVYAPLRKLGIQGGHSIAVIGIGGLGHLALQFARAMGCEVTAISHSASKEAEAKSFGASRFLTLDSSLLPSQFDLILSTVHEDLDWNRVVTWLKPKGTLCFLGRTKSPAQIDVGQLISPEKKITGSTTANRAIMNEMLQFAARHRIEPQIEEMPLSQINRAIERLKANQARYRIVLKVDKNGP